MSVHQIVPQVTGSSRLAWLCPDPETFSWSPGVFALLGLRDGSVQPSTDLFMSFVHPDDQHVRQVLTRREADGDGETFFRLVRRDGSLRLVSIVGLEGSGSDRSARLCLFDHSSTSAPRSREPRALMPRGSMEVDAPASWSLYDESANFDLSPAAREVFSLADGERLDIPGLLRRVHPCDRHAVESRFAEGSPGRVVARISRAAGERAVGERAVGETERWVEIALLGSADPGGSRFGRWGTVADVTDRARLDGRLSAAEDLLSSSFDGSLVGLVLLDRDGTIRRINSEGSRLLEGAAVGAVIWDAVPHLMADPIRLEVRDAAETRREHRDERFVPSLRRWLSYSLKVAGQQVLLSLLDRDELYEVRSRFQEYTTRCDAALDLGGVGVWEIDSRSDIVWFGASARGLLGARTMTSTAFYDRVVPDDRAEVRTACNLALTGGMAFDITFGITDADGRPLRVRARGGARRERLTGSPKVAGILMEVTAGSARAAPDVETDCGAQELLGIQVRAARGALRWSVRELAEHSAVSVATINRFEADSRPVITRDSSVAALHAVLRQHGVTFFTDRAGHPAVSVAGSETA